MYKTATITYTYGNGLISDSRKEAKGSDADGDLVEDKTAVIRSENLRFLYNGRYGVETGADGLYYMRARYYNPQIKRFINRDIIDGSITDSQSLNKYSYVQGNPVNLIDPFGLCAQDYFSRAGHELLDWLGFIFDPADAINFLWYTAEGNADMAAATAVAIVPAAGSFIVKGTKQAIKAGKKAAQKAGEKAAKNATEKAAKKAAAKKLAKEAAEKELSDAGKRSLKDISYKDYDSIYQSSIHNGGKNKVMLGKYDGGGSTSYITKAGDEYTYFSLGKEWDSIKSKYGYTDDEMFKLFNEAFLDDGINAKKTFYFSHNPQNAKGALKDEYQYLLKNNYKWDSKTMTMRP